MSQLSYLENIKTFVDILTTSSYSTITFVEGELDSYKFLAKTHFFEQSIEDLLENYVDKSLEEIDSISERKYVIIGFRTLEAALYQYKYLIPALNALKYYFLHLDLTSYVTMLKESQPIHYKVETLYDLYECLCKYNIELQKVILSEIDKEITHSELLYFLQEKNFVEFCNLIKNKQLDINKALHICSLHESFFLNQVLDKEYFFESIKIKFKKLFWEKKRINLNQLLSGDKKRDCASEFSFIFSEDFHLSKMTKEEYVSFVKYCLFKLFVYSDHFKDLNHFIEDGLVFIMCYKEHINETIFNHIVEKLTNTKSDYYNLIAKQCFNITTNKRLKLSTPFFNELIESAYSEETESDTSSSENMEFNLPNDLFEPNKHLTYHKKEEFFSLVPDLKIRKYPEILERLINELADWGYISNDSETKSLFAYRLTGKKILRPKELKPIQWNEQSRSKRGYSLLYLIKKLTNSNETGTYSKVKEFFIGPEWGKKLNQDANNKNGTIPFKRLLHEISPDDFPDPKTK